MSGWALVAVLWTMVSGIGVPHAPPSSAPNDPGAAPHVRLVLIWTEADHPYGTHMYRFECGLLAKCLNQTPGVEAVVCPDPIWPKNESILDGARGLVFYSRYAGDIVLSKEHRPRFESLMKSGAGYAALHWSTKAEDRALLTDYLEVLGGAFHSEPGWALETSTRRLEQIDPAHAICRGWLPYDLHDEWYLGMKFHERARPVLRVTLDSGKSETVAWTFERSLAWGGGRSFGSTLGHFHDNFRRAEFRRALVNGVLWSAGVDVPASGARVELNDEDLRLPPEGK
ncbi:MAG: ThuA domain-containing protein [Phycisphaerae bacterium]|nr:ThuA domain-containing protein [Phycisphaerae bacterium]